MTSAAFSPAAYRAPSRREVGYRIRLLREQAGYTKQHLAARAGISPRALDYIEHGEREPMSGTLFSIAAALNTSPTYLWTGN